MSNNDKDEKAKAFFESRFMSIILIICLLLMAALFIIVIDQLFGSSAALNVLMYFGIGAGGGIIFTFIIVLIFNKTKTKRAKNLILYMSVLVLVITLILSLILKYSFASTNGTELFINVNSIGLGITTGIATTYSILAIFRSRLVFSTNEEKIIEYEKDEVKQEILNDDFKEEEWF